MSAIEQRHQEHTHQNLFPFTFTDKNDKPFKAKPDLLIGTLYIELKESELNSITSITSSTNYLRTQYNYRFKKQAPLSLTHNQLSGALFKAGHVKDCLKGAWNHSVYKHMEVSKKLKEEGFNYWIVFSKHAPLVKYRKRLIPFKDYYKQRFNLTVMLESDYKKLCKSHTDVLGTPQYKH